ncbi:MAG: DUF4384 domain-containing protein [Paludibacteraceae bacterium]|nr:DUF4384 domain-containing protein [Paludibacteraceae bacterium]
MKKIALTLLAAFFCCLLHAQDIYVYSSTGSAEVQKGSQWNRLKKRDVLSADDVVRIAPNSCLTLLDKKAEKMYSIPQSSPKKLAVLIDELKGKQQNVTTQFFNHALKSMFNGGSDRISHEAAGCTYRGDIVENDIAKSLFAKMEGNSLKGASNQKTDYAISFELLERDGDNKNIQNEAKIGKQAIFRVKNNGDKPMYINVLDLDSNGDTYVCLPMDDAQTMSHLLIPAESTIDLIDYPIEFTEPAGEERMVMIATEEPYDLRIVNKYLKENRVKQTSSYPVGIYVKSLSVNK